MSKCWYCNEELLLGNNTMHIGICDKCYDEMFEMFEMGGKFIGKLTNKISDLEAKLAEKEVDILALDTDNYSFKQQIDNLRQQLAEKDEENKELIELNQVLQFRKNQDKISFCIENLEKVKELLLENLYDLYNKPSEIWDKYGDLYDVVVEGGINKTIDNQIASLKKGVE